jgi:type IV secretory pathway TrbD component
MGAVIFVVAVWATAAGLLLWWLGSITGTWLSEQEHGFRS